MKPKRETRGDGGALRLLFASAISLLTVGVVALTFPELELPDFSYGPESIVNISETLGGGDFLSEDFSDYAPIYLPTRINFARQPLSLYSFSNFEEDRPDENRFGEDLNDKSLALSKRKLISPHTALVKAVLFVPLTEAGRRVAFEEDFTATPSKKISWKLIDESNGEVVGAGEMDSEEFFSAEARVEKSALYGVSSPNLEFSRGTFDEAKTRKEISKIMRNAPNGRYRIRFDSF